MKNSLSIMAAFLGGAIIGGTLGVLFAPESGDETRKKIKDALEKRGINLSKDDLEDLVDEIKSQIIPEEKVMH
jgi:gas vesicle protein